MCARLEKPGPGMLSAERALGRKVDWVMKDLPKPTVGRKILKKIEGL